MSMVLKNYKMKFRIDPPIHGKHHCMIYSKQKKYKYKGYK